jgi:hypothetical protein
VSPGQKAWRRAQLYRVYRGFDAYAEDRPHARKPPAAKVTFVGGDPSGEPRYPDTVLVPLRDGGWATCSYTLWTWANRQGLTDWHWGNPQMGNPEAQVCAMRDGVAIGIANEMHRKGVGGVVRRV